MQEATLIAKQDINRLLQDRRRKTPFWKVLPEEDIRKRLRVIGHYLNEGRGHKGELRAAGLKLAYEAFKKALELSQDLVVDLKAGNNELKRSANFAYWAGTLLLGAILGQVVAELWQRFF